MPEYHVLEIRRTFEAPPERVFEAFGDPGLLGEWAADDHRAGWGSCFRRLAEIVEG